MVALALVLVGLGFFWASGLRDRISSDAGVTLLLARHVLDTGSVLPADWYYGNGDLWILGPHLLSLPFVALWGIRRWRWPVAMRLDSLASSRPHSRLGAPRVRAGRWRYWPGA